MPSYVIPATDTAPALRVYVCGCTFRHDGGWSHCDEHTNVHGILAAASKVSQATASEAAWRIAFRARHEAAGAKVSERFGGLLAEYPFTPQEPTR